MRRRDFLAAVGSASGASLATTTTATTVDPLELDSAASLLDADGSHLTDDPLIAVLAEARRE